MNGVDALFVSLLGTMIGGSIMLPFVLIGAFGAADALLLAAIGAWKGPPVRALDGILDIVPRRSFRDRRMVPRMPHRPLCPGHCTWRVIGRAYR